MLNRPEPARGPVTDPPRRVVVLANCASGGGSTVEERTGVLRTAFDGTGLAPDLRCVPGAELGRVARELAAEGPDALVAAGGDGTVSAVAGALAGTDVALGVLPLGTLNHFAKDAGIPLDVAEAARVVTAGATRRVDAATVNGHIFVNNSSVGLYPHTVRARDRRLERGGDSKPAATAKASWDVLRRLPLTPMRLWVDGRHDALVTPLLFVGNNRYTLEGLALGTRVSLSAGRLCVVHTRRTGRAALLLLGVRALAGALGGARDLTIEEAHEVRVELARGDVRVALDGEVFTLRPPLVYRALPGALRVLVPQERAA